MNRRPYPLRAIRPLSDRFWEKVDKNGPVPSHRPDLGPCWLWTAHTNAGGYGTIGAGRSNTSDRLAHRVAWELACGMIPPGQHALHHCDNPPCVNAAHLFLGSDATNVADMIAKGRMRAGEFQSAKTHCPHGHPYSHENTYWRPDRVGRLCRACAREAELRHRSNHQRLTRGVHSA